MIRIVVTYFNLRTRNTDTVDRFGLIDGASTANKCLYGPISRFPNFKEMAYGSLNCAVTELSQKVIAGSEDSVSAELLVLLELIREKTFNKHFTIFSEILVGLSSPEAFLS